MNISRIRSQWKSSWRYVKNAACIKREYIWSKLDKFPFFFFFRKISFRRFNAKAHVAGSFAFLYILRRSSFDFSSNPLCRYASIEIRANIAPERLEVDVSVKFLIFEGIQLALESKSYSKNSENQDWCTKGQALCSKISWKYFQAYQDKPS